jgi:hypothetical protein
LLLGVAIAVLLAVGVGLYATRDPRAEVVDESADPTRWKTIEYEGVRVDIPATWERLDMGDCEFQFEHWAPPDSPTCRTDAGVAFYGSRTFDPAHRPGVKRAEVPGPDTPDWYGYVYAGEFAVYASDDDLAVVKGILGSVK